MEKNPINLEQKSNKDSEINLCSLLDGIIRVPMPYHRFTPCELGDLCRALPGNVITLLTYEGDLPKEYRDVANTYSNVEIHDLLPYRGKVQVSASAKTVVQSISDTFNSILTPLIWERGTTSIRERISLVLRGNRKSFLKGSADITLQLLQWQNELSGIGANLVIYETTPHDYNSWAQMQMALCLDLTILIISRSAIPGFQRVYQLKGDNRSPLSTAAISEEHRRLYRERANRLIRALKSSYEEAMPDYERKRALESGGKYISVKRLIRNHWYVPFQLWNTIQSWRVLDKYSVQVSDLVPNSFCVLFLHYQPERTTVPDGGLFGAQLNALVTLRASLPRNIRLLVKEHPSTFRYRCDPLARDPDFYQKVSSIEGVDWIDISTDNFELIDKAFVTATITGTVALESLVRGTPSIMFGWSYFGKSEGFLPYSDSAGLDSFIAELREGKFPRDVVSKAAADMLMREEKWVFCCESTSFSKTKTTALSALFSRKETHPLRETHEG